MISNQQFFFPSFFSPLPGINQVLAQQAQTRIDGRRQVEPGDNHTARRGDRSCRDRCCCDRCRDGEGWGDGSICNRRRLFPHGPLGWLAGWQESGSRLAAGGC